MGKIKLTYMIDVLDTNLAGTENQLIKMINGIDKDAFQVNLICFDDSKWLNENRDMLHCQATVIEINRFKRLYTYGNFFKLAGNLRANRPDIVHTFFPVANIVGVTAARMSGVKKVVSSRRDYGEWMNGRYLAATKMANRFVDRIVANSGSVKELTARKESVDPARIDVFYNGLDTAQFQNLERDGALKARLGIPAANKVVGIIANFRPMKHHHAFVLAAREVLRQRKDVHFMMIGAGQLKEKTERLADELGISSNIIFAGAQKDTLPFLSIMDVGVNCSEAEGLSNSVMEYMASGVPCVVSDAGGNRDLITHNETGYVFKLDDFEGMAGFILKLFKEDKERKVLCANAAEKVRSSMSLETMLKNYESFYKRLLG